MREEQGPCPGAVVVAVGDELLLGQTVNANAGWLGRALSDLGFRMRRQEAVGDETADIQRSVTVALQEADLVVVTGGLGPTPDDLTRPAVAEVLGFPLREDPDLVKFLEGRSRARGLARLPENNRRMAQIPRGAQVLPNPLGAAPGLVLEMPGPRPVILLPGIPGEMRGIFREGVEPYLRGVFGPRLRPVFSRMVYTTGIPESLLSRELVEVLGQDPPSVGVAYLPDLRGVRIRLTVQGVGRLEAEEMFDRLEGRMETVLAPYRYRSDAGDLAESLGAALRKGGMTLSTAESCTGGLIAKRLTDFPGSSAFFLGGVVAYSDEVKEGYLGITRSLLEDHGAVSRPVAEAMARGVAERFGSGAGIGVTGIAGPGGGTEEKPVGTVWYAVALGGRVVSRADRFLGGREAVRERAAQAAMALLLMELNGGMA